jgi:AraC-like DNA-binding protein
MNARTLLLTSPIGLVENVVAAGSSRRPSAEDFSPDFQVAFPYRGLFIWHVGHDHVVGDTNQILFVTGGEAYRASGPRPGGYAELIITPAMPVLSEITEAAGFAPHDHPLFRVRSHRATPFLQGMCARLLHGALAENGLEPLGAEEAVVALLRAALQIEPARLLPSERTRNLISRTREFLHAEFPNPIRLSDVARAVGASPAYLTDVFRRFEGVPLQRYVTQLRLARALIELPDSDDLTALALDLGFSSHSHFTLAFRRAFGCTPSRFRKTTRHGKRAAATAAGTPRRAHETLGGPRISQIA